MDLFGDRSPAETPETQRGIDGLSALSARRLQVRPEKGDSGSQNRGPVASHPDGRLGGIEILEEHEVDAPAKACCDNGYATDMRDWPWDRVYIRLTQTHEVQQPVCRSS